MLPPTIKAKWVGALRSGAYRQGRDRLYTDHLNAYCCLGVLCDVMGAERERSEFGAAKFRWPSPLTYKEHSASSTELPESLRLELHMARDEEAHLVYMNDTENKSFHEIADWIEKNL